MLKSSTQGTCCSVDLYSYRKTYWRKGKEALARRSGGQGWGQMDETTSWNTFFILLMKKEKIEGERERKRSKNEEKRRRKIRPDLKVTGSLSERRFFDRETIIISN